jgi:hypothetical protein
MQDKYRNISFAIIEHFHTSQPILTLASRRTLRFALIALNASTKELAFKTCPPLEGLHLRRLNSQAQDRAT